MQKITKIAELKNINLQPEMFHLGKFSPVCFSCWHSLCMLDFQQMVCVSWWFLCTTKLVSTNNIKSQNITQTRDAHKSKSSPFTMQESKPDDNHTGEQTQKKKQNNQSFYFIIFFCFCNHIYVWCKMKLFSWCIFVWDGHRNLPTSKPSSKWLCAKFKKLNQNAHHTYMKGSVQFFCRSLVPCKSWNLQ